MEVKNGVYYTRSHCIKLLCICVLNIDRNIEPYLLGAEISDAKTLIQFFGILIVCVKKLIRVFCAYSTENYI